MCAGGRRPAREPSALRASLGASSRSPARPRRRPPASRQVPPAPSTPVVLVVLVCSARPRRRPPASRQVPLAPFTPVVPGVLMCGSVRRLEARPGPATASSISHAIPSDVFHGLKCDRWNSADSALVWGRAELELHAELGEFPVSLVELVAQGCTTWVGIALLSCRCNAVLSGALVLYLVHRFAVVKLVTPFRPCVSAGLKPASPLLA